MNRTQHLRHPGASGPDHWGPIAWSAAVFAAALIGAWGSSDAPSVYTSLHRPPWAPPGSLFGPVWTLLYLMLAGAAALAAQAPATPQRRQALLTLGVSLVPLALWSWTFFAWRSSVMSITCIALLGGLVLASVLQLWPVKRAAALLLLPLLAWVTFAAALNFEIVRLNPLL